MTSSKRAALGSEMMTLIEELYPICRSITGAGVRKTLGILNRHLPLEITEVRSGTEVLDWTVPEEWNIKDAWIKDGTGKRVVDFNASNLHVLNYSTPVEAQKISREALDAHLFSIPEHPDWIPYRTSYYKPAWGFCLAHAVRENLREQEYEICIDSCLGPGNLTYGECFFAGGSDEEILISAHVCHPSLCNDNLSGIAVATALGRALAEEKHRFSYRILFAPGTIGTLAWMAKNQQNIQRIRAGLTLTCLGDERNFTYKKTVSGTHTIDRAAAHILAMSNREHHVIDFTPYGYDERQHNSPGFRLPVGSLMRGRHGQFPEYHTSADNLNFVDEKQLIEAVETIGLIVKVIEGNRRYRNTSPYGEPQLGKRGIYGALGGETDASAMQMAILWVLNLSDGNDDLLDIAVRAGIPFATIRAAADLLLTHDLLTEVAAKVTT